MNENHVLQFLAYLLPAVATGIIAFYFFRLHTRNEEGRRRFLLHKDFQKDTLPLRLQAYERMVLFLERITIPSLVVRVAPQEESTQAYENLLIKQIETEFDHNLTQQLYLSETCWNVIKTAKNTTIRMIRAAGMSKTDSPDKLRERLLNQTLDKPSPADTALTYLKKEVQALW